MHIKSILHNSIAMLSLKNFHPGGLRTLIFWNYFVLAILLIMYILFEIYGSL
jgi:hypothetical protein